VPEMVFKKAKEMLPNGTLRQLNVDTKDLCIVWQLCI